MPDLNGIDATQQLATDVPGAKVIGLSMHFDKRYVARMLNAGASGYLRKACASEEVIKAIHTVMNGKFYISDGTSNITVKNKEQYLVTNQLVDLNLSIKTIEKHRSNIMEKLKIRSIAELTKFAIIEGITSLER